MSGSYINNKSFDTDYTGNIDNGVYTSSIHFSNEILMTTNEVLGERPLGTTIQFKPSGSIDFGGGKYLDETFIYPANHVYVVGSSKDSLSSLTYDGTQNNGGDILESQAFTDLWAEKAFYYVPTTGGENWQVPWSNS